MSDMSHLDKRYFVDKDVYNCPFCNRNNVPYSVEDSQKFDWSKGRTAYCYIVQCSSCMHKSIHFSNYKMFQSNSTYPLGFGYKRTESPPQYIPINDQDIDEQFFYHQPTTFFTIDERIPSKIRSLVSEAYGCKKMNYLIGASGSLRKAIYELLSLQNTDQEKSYDERIKELKTKHPTIFPECFDALAGITDVTSQQLHEQDGNWEGQSSRELDYILEAVIEVLNEIYVIPDERKKRLETINKLRKNTKQPEDNNSHL